MMKCSDAEAKALTDGSLPPSSEKRSGRTGHYLRHQRERAAWSEIRVGIGPLAAQVQRGPEEVSCGLRQHCPVRTAGVQGAVS